MVKTPELFSQSSVGVCLAGRLVVSDFGGEVLHLDADGGQSGGHLVQEIVPVGGGGEGVVVHAEVVRHFHAETVLAVRHKLTIHRLQSLQSEKISSNLQNP